MKPILASWLILTSLVVTLQAQSIQQLGPNYYAAGIPSDEFEYYAAAQSGGRQRAENWCWAACIQMVLNYHGVQVSQEQVVARIYGGLTDQPGTLSQMQQALSGWAPNVNGRYSMIYSQAGFTSINEITQNLAYKWPIIVGLRSPNGGTGHAYVLTAIYYSLDMYGNTIPDKVVLRDPWPGSPSRQEMSWYAFQQRLDIGLKVWVTR